MTQKVQSELIENSSITSAKMANGGAAAGYHTGLPNTDQAHGFEYGRH